MTHTRLLAIRLECKTFHVDIRHSVPAVQHVPPTEMHRAVLPESFSNTWSSWTTLDLNGSTITSLLITHLKSLLPMKDYLLLTGMHQSGQICAEVLMILCICEHLLLLQEVRPAVLSARRSQQETFLFMILL